MSFTTDDQSGDTSAADQAAIKAAADQAAQQAAPAASTTDNHNQVFLVAGERAFSDAGAVVKHVEHSQSHIATLETEAETSRGTIAEQAAEILRLKKVEEALNGQSTTGTVGQTDLLSNEQLATNAAKLAQGMIAEQSTVNAQNSNLAAVEAAAEKVYGEGYQAKVGEIAKKLGMTLQEVDSLGRTSPDAFSKLFLPADAGSSHQPSSGTIQRSLADQQQLSNQQPRNITKMREPERRTLVAEKMKAAGVEGY